MMTTGMGRPNDTDGLLRLAAGGDLASWGELLTRHAGRLRRMVAIRLDPRLARRVDADDVVQEALGEAIARLPEYLERPALPFFLWLRLLVGQKLIQLQRLHLGTQKRAADREVSLFARGMPQASSVALAERLLGRDTRASEALVRAERKLRLQEALNSMDGIDREVLVLRHFEELSNGECARVLEISESAAAKRYIRALKRLRDVLTARPGETTGFWT
jgi:RNA polymerase sigma-70 factor (ECF subfamily)